MPHNLSAINIAGLSFAFAMVTLFVLGLCKAAGRESMKCPCGSGFPACDCIGTDFHYGDVR